MKRRWQIQRILKLIGLFEVFGRGGMGSGKTFISKLRTRKNEKEGYTTCVVA